MNPASLASWALHTSLSALPLALAVLLLARCRLCQPRWRMWIAALFFIRLALPAVPEVSWNAWAPKAPATIAFASDPLPAAAAATTFEWKLALPALWLAGVVVTLGWLVASHFLTRRWILQRQAPSLRWFEALADWARERQGVTQHVPVLVVRELSTMAIFGWLRPRLLIPADLADRYTGEQIRGMLLHEFAHVRRRDVLWTWLSLIACALHWFNPLAWLAFRRFCADRELVCDAAALDCLGHNERLSYGDALLRSLDVTPLTPAPSLAPFFRIHPEIKHRILMITKPVLPTAWSRLAAALLVPALSLLAFTTSRAQDAEKPKPEGEKPKTESRDGEKPKAGARDGERPREGARDGEGRKPGPRDGETKKEGEGTRKPTKAEERRREREMKRERGRDGEAKKEGAREGDSRKSGPRDGEMKKEGSRDGDRPREGARDGEGRKPGPRDGEAKKEGPRDGDKPREGERSPKDGEKREGQN